MLVRAENKGLTFRRFDLVPGQARPRPARPRPSGHANLSNRMAESTCAGCLPCMREPCVGGHTTELPSLNRPTYYLGDLCAWSYVEQDEGRGPAEALLNLPHAMLMY